MTYKVTSMVKKPYRPLFSNEDIPMWVATVEHEQGHVFTFSHRQDDDPGVWYADAVILPNGAPHFVHGEGERTVAKRAATPEVTYVLNVYLGATAPVNR